MSSSRGTGVSVGGSSILVIFVLLCLTTFATLSLVSANADKKLTDKTAQATREYYAADANAEEMLSVVDGCLVQARTNAKNEADYLKTAGQLLSQSATPMKPEGDLLRYSVPVNDSQELQVVLQILYPESAGQPAFKRKEWKVVNTGDWQPDEESLTLWNGSDDLVLFAE